MRPLLLLDVDGVCCPFASGLLKQQNQFPGFTWYPDYFVHISDAVGGYVRALSDHFDVHWCTGWQEAANEVIAPLMRLPQFPIVPLDTASLDDPHWKWTPIKRYVKGRRYAFVDDEITSEAARFARAHGEPHKSSLWLPVNAKKCLSQNHVNRLIEWAHEASVPAAA